MAKIAGRQVEVGIGIETVAGTAVAATDYFKWDTFSMQSMSDKILLNSARGIRNKASNSLIIKKYGKGSLEFVPNVDVLPYVLGMALGTRTTGTHSGESVIYDHVFTIQNANASMKTATLLVKQGGIQTERYSNCVVDTLDLTFDKDFAKANIGMIAAFPDTGSVTPAYTQDTLFSRNQLAVQFGTSLSDAAMNTALPLVAFTLNQNNSVLFEDAFLSGANTPVAGGFIAGPLEIKGTYTLQFSSTAELAKYQANTKNAIIATVTGAAIGVAAFEQVIINIGRATLTKAPLEYNLDGLVYLKQEFTVEYDATDHELAITVTNGYAGTNYH